LSIFCGSARVRIYFPTQSRHRLSRRCLKALELLTASTELRDKLEENTKYFREAVTERGLTSSPAKHPKSYDQECDAGQITSSPHADAREGKKSDT